MTSPKYDCCTNSPISFDYQSDYLGVFRQRFARNANLFPGFLTLFKVTGMLATSAELLVKLSVEKRRGKGQ